jgi:hypothetical protein
VRELLGTAETLAGSGGDDDRPHRARHVRRG